MKIISRQECQEWLSVKLGKKFDWHSVKESYPFGVRYRLPVDTGKKTAVARFMSREVDTTEPGLLWITGWEIFPSSENTALFDGYRKSLGEHRTIDAAPGHVFSEEDIVHVECLLDLSLYFYWNVSLFDGRGIWIATSHDEYFLVNAQRAASLDAFVDGLSRLELQRLDV